MLRHILAFTKKILVHSCGLLMHGVSPSVVFSLTAVSWASPYNDFLNKFNGLRMKFTLISGRNSLSYSCNFKKKWTVSDVPIGVTFVLGLQKQISTYLLLFHIESEKNGKNENFLLYWIWRRSFPITDT